ncbi:MAG: hypothetical protein P9L94_18535 [Candidatus Hinthialibacter antarcticus]|nr:hypothetical protein [Candidatus Hinthialibacter antarcticus]
MKSCLLIFVVLMLLASPIIGTCQQQIVVGQTLTGVLSAEQPVANFTMPLEVRGLFQLQLNIEERNFDIALALTNPDGEFVAQNTGRNYPAFQGAYLLQTLVDLGTYTIQISASGIEAPVDFSFSVHALSDTNTIAFLTKDSPKQGLIASSIEQDQYLLDLARGQAVVLAVMTPDLVLNPIMGVFSPTGERLFVVDDFATTEPIALLVAEESGVHTVVVAPRSNADLGPYRIVAHDAPEVTLGEATSGDVRTPGDVAAFELPLLKGEAYDFIATGVDGLESSLILMEASGNFITLADPDVDEPTTTVLPGFTPVRDESLFMLVIGAEHENTGLFDFEARPLEDENDDRWLTVGETATTVIGPVGDVDRYKIQVDSGRDYSLLALSIWHLLDPSLRVLNENNEEVFFNDNAVLSTDSLLSGIQFPAAGEYVIEIAGSPNQPNAQAQTGVAAISFATGAPFDNAPPAMNDPAAVVTYADGNVHVMLPDGSVLDDTMPVNATVIVDKTQASGEGTFEQDGFAMLEAPANDGDIVFVKLRDTSDAQNEYLSPALPGPTRLAQINGTPFAVAVDDANKIYLTESASGRIITISQSGRIEVAVGDLPTSGGSFGPNGLAFDHDGALHFCNAADGTVKKLLGTQTEIVVDGLNFPTAIAFDEAGTLFVAQRGSDVIEKVFPNGDRSVIVSTVRNPNALAFGPDNLLYFGNDEDGQSNIYRLASDGSVEVYADGVASAVESMAFDRDGYLYVADGTPGFLYRIAPDGETVVFTRGLSGAVGMAFGHGEFETSIFAANMGLAPDRRYPGEVIRIPTGRPGIELPFASIPDWMLME